MYRTVLVHIYIYIYVYNIINKKLTSLANDAPVRPPKISIVPIKSTIFAPRMERITSLRGAIECSKHNPMYQRNSTELEHWVFVFLFHQKHSHQDSLEKHL